MQMIYRIPFKPIPWARAGRSGGRTYDTQVKAKRAIQAIIRSQRGCGKASTLPLMLTLEFHMRMPKAKKVSEGSPHISRPDLDNLVKFIKDALNGVLWQDDALIYKLVATKFYAPEEKTLLVVQPYDGGSLDNLLA